MESEYRMIGEYEIWSSVEIGRKEIVLGRNDENTDGAKFMCGFVERNELVELCSDCMVSDDYAEIMQLFGKRVQEEAELFRASVRQLGIPITVITEDDCIPDDYTKDIVGKIIALKPSILKPEFQRADRQLYLVTGGFGAYGNFRGSSITCKNLHTGETCRNTRYDVMGEIKPERMPKWAKEKEQEMEKNRAKKHKDRER